MPKELFYRPNKVIYIKNFVDTNTVSKIFNYFRVLLRKYADFCELSSKNYSPSDDSKLKCRLKFFTKFEKISDMEWAPQIKMD